MNKNAIEFQFRGAKHLENRHPNMKKQIKQTSKINARILTFCAALGLALQGYSQPTTVAPTPTPPQGHVISLWNSSAIYTNVPVDNYFEVWYGSTPGTYTIPSTANTVFDELGMVCCAAIEMQNDPKNVAGCTNLHLDVFTPNGNNLTIRLVDSTSAQADMNYTVAGGVITNNGWISLNIPLSTFAGVNLHSIKQLGWIDNAGATPADYYFDNIYFSGATNLVYTPPPPIPVPTNNAPTPTRPKSSVVAMYNSSSTYSLWPGSAGVNWDAGWSGSAELPFVITNQPNTVMYLPGLTFVGVEFYGGDSLDVSGATTMHLDLWPLRGDQFGIQLVSLSPTVAGQVYVPINTSNQWVSIDVPLSQFTASAPALVLNNLQQLLWVDNGGSGIQNGTFYVDNIYFWNTNQVQSSVSVGKQVSWTASSGNTYQPQKSANGSTWSNFGSLISGSSPNSVFDAAPSPYYHVIEVTSGAINGVVNGGFETLDGSSSSGALGWLAAGSGGAIATPVAVKNLDPHIGSYELDIEGQGNGAGAGPVALQNSIPATAGAATLSFYVKGALMAGGANPQYNVNWYDASGSLLGASGFQSFTPLTSSYVQKTINLTAPANTDHAQIQFLLAVGAGTGDHWLMRLDDVALTHAGLPATNTLSATVQSAAGITWQSGVGLTYTVQASPSLVTPVWSPLGADVIGTGTNTVPDVLSGSGRFYRVLEDY